MHSKLAKESATITCIWHEGTPRQGGGKCSGGKERELQVCYDWRLFAPDAGGWLTRSRLAIFCDWFGRLSWLSVVGPELEARAKIREAGGR